jgi:hypothetical protein
MYENRHKIYDLRNDEERSRVIFAVDKKRSWFEYLSVQLIMQRTRPMGRILMSVVSRNRLSIFPSFSRTRHNYPKNFQRGT